MGKCSYKHRWLGWLRPVLHDDLLGLLFDLKLNRNMTWMKVNASVACELVRSQEQLFIRFVEGEVHMENGGGGGCRWEI